MSFLFNAQNLIRARLPKAVADGRRVGEKGEKKMKILKKPKILPCTCKKCKCEFLPAKRDLYAPYNSIVADMVICPFCNASCEVKFEVSYGKEIDG